MEFLSTPWGFGSIAVVVAGLVMIVFGRGRVQIGRDGIRTGPEGNKAEPIMPEKYAREVLILVERSGDHRDKLRDIRSGALEDQMRAYEEMSVAAVATFKAGFAEIAERLHLPVDQARRERSAFVHMVKVAERDVKDEMRRWFHANHYYAMSTSERADYIETKQRTLFHIIADAFDHEWVSDIIPRDELRRIGDTRRTEFDKLVEALFTRAFQISERALAAENEEKAIYSAYMMKATGFDPYNREAC